MDLSELKKHLRQNPDYVAAEKELRPFGEVALDVIRLRSRRGWTQAQLAQKVGTKQANISRLERSSTNPSLKFLQKVADALDARLVVHIEPVESRAEQTTSPSNAAICVPDWPVPGRLPFTISGGDVPNDSARLA